MSLVLAPHVQMFGLRPETLLAIQVAYSIWKNYFSEPSPMIITSIVDGDHDGGPLETSSHYSGTAFDIDLGMMSSEDRQSYADTLEAALTKEFHLHLYNDPAEKSPHVHIAYIPRRPASL